MQSELSKRQKKTQQHITTDILLHQRIKCYFNNMTLSQAINTFSIIVL